MNIRLSGFTEVQNPIEKIIGGIKKGEWIFASETKSTYVEDEIHTSGGYRTGRSQRIKQQACEQR